MAAKKYLSLEEAAQLLGVRSDEVIRLRERGELRGFADRGTWKFKSDDVEEAKRRRQTDSSPDVPLMGEDTEVMKTPLVSGPKSDSDVRLVAADNLRASLTGSSHDMPAIKTGKGSDSDVRLVGAGPVKDSDSDVKLIKPKDSDSDVKLSGSDSDVRLASKSGKSMHDSDSDVRLAMPEGSDSDVRLAVPMGSDSDVKLIDDSRAEDEGASILMEPDSGIRLTGDSGLRLGGDSGISLSSPADSGILLERAGDKPFSFDDDDDSPVFKLAGDDAAGKSGPKLAKPAKQSLTDDELNISAPMLFEGEDDSRTDPDVPMLMDEEDEAPIPSLSGLDKTASETSVILFDEEDPDATVLRKPRPGSSLATEEYDADAVEEVEDLEIEADEGDLDEMEVFESEDSDFDESFEEGASAAEISAFRGKIAAPVDQEWGTGMVLMLSGSTIAMAVGVIIAVDLLRTVWGADGAVYPGELVGSFGGMFK
jgi:excisionase family DNA binding protein